jgi:hypothetical protein
VGQCPRGQLQAAGIEPVTDRAFQPIEAAALGGFEALAAEVAAGRRLAPEARPSLAGPAPAPDVRVA